MSPTRFVVLALLMPSVAAAERKIAVDFLCGEYAHDEIVAIVPSPDAPRLERPVACALHLRAAGSATYQGRIATVRHLANPATGDHADVETTGVTGTVAHRPGTDGDDLEVVLVPDVDDANGEVPFAACERFDIVASLADARGGTVWTKTLAVEQRCPTAPAPPPEPRAIEGRGTGLVGVDQLLPGNLGPVVGYGFQVGASFLFAVGGCTSTGAATECAATVWNRKGKRVGDYQVSMDDPMSEDEGVDYTELDLARTELARVVGHQDGWALTAHDLTGGQLRFDTIDLAWNKARTQLTIRNAGRVWKKVKTPRVPRGHRIDAATLYFLEGGDPMAGVLKIDVVDRDGMPGGDGGLFALVPLPPLAND